MHRSGSGCPRSRPLWLDERGTSGDLADLVVRCECGKSRGMYEATMIELAPLGISGSCAVLDLGSAEILQEEVHFRLHVAQRSVGTELPVVLGFEIRVEHFPKQWSGLL